MRRATIVKWENGQDNPKLDNIQKIAKKGFGISISKLLEGVGGS
jgi:transcriptional regulator with XRE-family HTH domain